MLECLEIAPRSARPRSRCGWPTAPTTRARTTCAPAARGCSTSLAQVYAQLPADQELLVEYKLFEPAFYATDLADWGSALLTCLKLGERARVLVDLGHHAQGTNIEQIVALPGRRGPARRLPLQQPQVRRRRPDRRLGEPVRAVPDLLRAGRAAALPRLTIDQSHNIEAKVEAMVLERRQPQEAYAKALLVDRDGAARRAGGGRRARRPRGAARRVPHRRPRAVRRRARALGAAEDPIAARRASGYAERGWPSSERRASTRQEYER